jgi:hypothetical protein
MGKKTKFRIWDEHPGSYFRELSNNFWVKSYLNSFDADADLDANLYNSGPGIREGTFGSG